MSENKITKNEIANLMLEVIEKHITFMFSQSGLPNDYNIYMAKMVKPCDNRCLRLGFDENNGRIYQCADEEFFAREFFDITGVMEYAYNYFEIKEQADEQ